MACNANLFNLLVVFTVLFCSCNAIRVRWCTISDAEQNKCRQMSTSFESEYTGLYEVGCFQSSSHLACMQAISDNSADVVTLDGGDILVAGRDYGMKPVVSEDYGSGDSSYWAIAVARVEDVITIDDLEGKKSCHTGIGKTSGWNVPIGMLIEKDYIQVNDECNVPKAVGEFFVESCVPGAKETRYDPNGDNPENLCDLCIGEGDNNCARSQVEPYYDYSGSFRCLAEGAGDVAFMKHTTIPDNTDGNTPPEWGFNATSTDYKLLCEDGTTELNVNNYLSCNLARVPSHAVMINGDKSIEFVKSAENLLLQAQEIFGSDDNTNGFKMFDSSDFDGVDLIFKDSTIELLSVGSKDTYEEFLGDEYLEATKAINCENGAAFLAGSFLVMLSSLMLLFGLK